jgi:hypothetical protein
MAYLVENSSSTYYLVADDLASAVQIPNSADVSALSAAGVATIVLTAGQLDSIRVIG